jgi:hypothetical protein
MKMTFALARLPSAAQRGRRFPAHAAAYGDFSLEAPLYFISFREWRRNAKVAGGTLPPHVGRTADAITIAATPESRTALAEGSDVDEAIIVVDY